MREGFLKAVLAVALICAPAVARADVWDLGSDNDNDFGSDNELVHGLEQVHDMAAQQGGTVEDVDWYRFNQQYNTSFEIVLDGLTGDVSNGTTSPALELLLDDATTVIGSSQGVTGFGTARSLRGLQPTGTPGERVLYVRVSSPSCGLNCTASDQYRVRFYDTTCAVPRYNNANGQVTVLVLQNTTAQAVTGYVLALGPSGISLGGFPVNLLPYQVTTFNLAAVANGALSNTSGGLLVMNDAPYGTLAGKAVALEPTTGFTFDTPLVSRPH
jgi:hypothetical protein